MFSKKVLLIIITLFPMMAFALPIDWHGVFGVDTTLIDNYRKISQTSQSVIGSGSQEVDLAAGGHANASFQSYVFRLNPTLIVNDAATLKGEITSGYGRGGFLGDNPSQAQEPGFGATLYGQNLASSSQSLNINKFYVELYSDTATYLIGRHSAHWGLGAFYNSGENTWDRHTFIRDGITLKFKLGNFHVEPYYSKVGALSSLTRATSVSEIGVGLLYDNPENEMTLGILFGNKEGATFENSIQSGTTTADTDGDGTNVDPVGKSDVSIIDIYFQKKFGNFSFGFEVPLLSGEIGYIYDTTTTTKYKAKALLFESSYKVNNTFTFGFNAGQVSGDDGGQSSFDAFYLNPNYQVALVLFRYNTRAVTLQNSNGNNQSIHDSYITNAFYWKVYANWQFEKWTFDLSFIMANAQDTAIAGTNAFNHTTGVAFTAAANQADDLGKEIDLSLTYHWNDEVTVNGSFGYLLTGDYWGFTNTATSNTAENSYVAQLRTSIAF